MCGLCELLAAEPGWHDGSVDQRPAFASRHGRAERLNQLLAPLGLSVRPWAGGLLLRSATGRSETVRDLVSLWPAAERLSGRRIDPLSDASLWRD